MRSIHIDFTDSGTATALPRDGRLFGGIGRVLAYFTVILIFSVAVYTVRRGIADRERKVKALAAAAQLADHERSENQYVVDPKTVGKVLKAPGIVILDVRATPNDYHRSHLPDATWLSSQIGSMEAFAESRVKSLRTAQMVLVYGNGIDFERVKYLCQVYRAMGVNAYMTILRQSDIAAYGK